jgi:DNA-directed RNA polymerase specialized sigma24 family protein
VTDPAEVVESRSAVIDALRAVSVDQREALLLVEVLGLSAEEAGRVLRVDPSAVRSRIHRARATLCQRLGGPDE